MEDSRPQPNQKDLQLFSRKRKLRVRAPGSKDGVLMRFPTDDEWLAYMRRSVFTVKGEQAFPMDRQTDKHFAEELTLEGTIPEGYEGWAVGRLLRFQAQSCTVTEAGTVALAANVAGGGIVVYELRMPTAEEAARHLSQSYAAAKGGLVSDAARQLEMYERFATGTPLGYAPGEEPPAWHKVGALWDAMDHIRELLRADDADFFEEEAGPSDPSGTQGSAASSSGGPM